jgi:segregation and condensation protein B
MPPMHLRSAIEALLFSSEQPLPLSLICDALEAPIESVAEELHALGEDYVARGAGVEVREIAGGYLLTTTAEHSEWVARMLRGKKRMRLSRAALETMAIIAYKQPVTKSEVEAIRGVDSSAVLATLLERNLVTIRGRSKVVGRPLLYGTTHEFLDYFGLRDLTELPRPEELRALVAAREPEQLDMMEVEVVSQVAADLAANEAANPGRSVTHEIEPLESAEADEDEYDEASEDEDEYDEDDGDEDDTGDPEEDEDAVREDEMEHVGLFATDLDVASDEPGVSSPEPGDEDELTPEPAPAMQRKHESE